MSERPLTVDNTDYIGKEVVSYMLHARPDAVATKQIEELQRRLAAEFTSSLWLQPPDTFHITILDYLAPLVDYGTDKDVLFEQYGETYDHATATVLKHIPPQHIRFNRLLASPSALFLVADEAADTFNAIRSDFLSRVELLPGTKMPPSIVHSTIARFVDEVPLDHVEEFVAAQSVSIETTIDQLQLNRETTVPMLAHSVIKTYRLLQDKLSAL